MRGARKFRRRRIAGMLLALCSVIVWLAANPETVEIWRGSTEIAGSETADAETTEIAATAIDWEQTTDEDGALLATAVLARLQIKTAASHDGYARTEFYNNWPTIDGCSLRQRIIKREMGDSAVLDSDNCTVIAGTYVEPYTGKTMSFSQKSDFSTGVQIDHVVALSNAWSTGAQEMTSDERYNLATDPLNLLAVDATTNQNKSDGDASTWLPPNVAFRCQYVARQVSVKYKYTLWVTQAEYDAIVTVLETCPEEPAVGVELAE